MIRDYEYGDTISRGTRHRRKGKRRKPYFIECRFPTTCFGWSKKWWVWGRYETEARRDQALEALVKKAERGILRAEYRKGIR